MINSLRANSTINFLHTDKWARADWWDIALIDYNDIGEESAAMREIFAATGV